MLTEDATYLNFFAIVNVVFSVLFRLNIECHEARLGHRVSTQVMRSETDGTHHVEEQVRAGQASAGVSRSLQVRFDLLPSLSPGNLVG